MFMICSGGGWWYRFCRQSETNTTYPSIPQPINSHYTTHNTRDSHRRNSTELSSRRSRSSHYHGRSRNRDQFYLSHMWKGPSNQFPPSYFSSNQYSLQTNGQHTTNFHQECPYHILYGPPPSYDSVIQISDSSGNNQPTCTLVDRATSSTSSIRDEEPNDDGNALPSVSPKNSISEKNFQSVVNSVHNKNLKNSKSLGQMEHINQMTDCQFSTIPSTSKGRGMKDKSQITSV